MIDQLENDYTVRKWLKKSRGMLEQWVTVWLDNEDGNDWSVSKSMITQRVKVWLDIDYENDWTVS